MGKYIYSCLLRFLSCQPPKSVFIVFSFADSASPSDSLLYFRHAFLLDGLPQFLEVTYLGSQPIQRYDKNTEKMWPLTLWINQTVTEVYWNLESSDANMIENRFVSELQEGEKTKFSSINLKIHLNSLKLNIHSFRWKSNRESKQMLRGWSNVFLLTATFQISTSVENCLVTDTAGCFYLHYNLLSLPF